MAEETGKGAWRWRVTIKDGNASEREEHWDPEATPTSGAQHDRLLEILFGPPGSSA